MYGNRLAVATTWVCLYRLITANRFLNLLHTLIWCCVWNCRRASSVGIRTNKASCWRRSTTATLQLSWFVVAYHYNGSVAGSRCCVVHWWRVSWLFSRLSWRCSVTSSLSLLSEWSTASHRFQVYRVVVTVVVVVATTTTVVVIVVKL